MFLMTLSVFSQATEPTEPDYPEGRISNSLYWTEKQFFNDSLGFGGFVKFWDDFETQDFTSQQIDSVIDAWKAGEFTSVAGGFSAQDSTRLDSLWETYIAGSLGGVSTLEEAIAAGDSAGTAASGYVMFRTDFTLAPSGDLLINAEIITNSSGTSSEWNAAKLRVDSLVGALGFSDLQIIGDLGSTYDGDSALSWYYHPTGEPATRGTQIIVTDKGFEIHNERLVAADAMSSEMTSNNEGLYFTYSNDVTNTQGTFTFKDNRLVISLPDSSLLTGAVEGGSYYGNRYTDLSFVQKKYVDIGDSTLAADAFDGDYNSLANPPNLFSGDYTDLTSKPTYAAGKTRVDMTGHVTPIDADTNKFWVNESVSNYDFIINTGVSIPDNKSFEIRAPFSGYVYITGSATLLNAGGFQVVGDTIFSGGFVYPISTNTWAIVNGSVSAGALSEHDPDLADTLYYQADSSATISVANGSLFIDSDSWIDIHGSYVRTQAGLLRAVAGIEHVVDSTGLDYDGKLRFQTKSYLAADAGYRTVSMTLDGYRGLEYGLYPDANHITDYTVLPWGWVKDTIAAGGGGGGSTLQQVLDAGFTADFSPGENTSYDFGPTGLEYEVQSVLDDYFFQLNLDAGTDAWARMIATNIGDDDTTGWKLDTNGVFEVTATNGMTFTSDDNPAAYTDKSIVSKGWIDSQIPDSTWGGITVNGEISSLENIVFDPQTDTDGLKTPARTTGDRSLMMFAWDGSSYQPLVSAVAQSGTPDLYLNNARIQAEAGSANYSYLDFDFTGTSSNADATFDFNQTANRVYTWPDKDGTVAMLSDVGGGGGALNTLDLADTLMFQADTTAWIYADADAMYFQSENSGSAPRMRLEGGGLYLLGGIVGGSTGQEYRLGQNVPGYHNEPFSFGKDTVANRNPWSTTDTRGIAFVDTLVFLSGDTIVGAAAGGGTDDQTLQEVMTQGSTASITSAFNITTTGTFSLIASGQAMALDANYISMKPQTGTYGVLLRSADESKYAGWKVDNAGDIWFEKDNTDIGDWVFSADAQSHEALRLDSAGNAVFGGSVIAGAPTTTIRSFNGETMWLDDYITVGSGGYALHKTRGFYPSSYGGDTDAQIEAHPDGGDVAQWRFVSGDQTGSAMTGNPLFTFQTGNDTVMQIDSTGIDVTGNAVFGGDVKIAGQNLSLDATVGYFGNGLSYDGNSIDILQSGTVAAEFLSNAISLKQPTTVTGSLTANGDITTTGSVTIGVNDRIYSTGSAYINIDSDNNATDRIFAVLANASNQLFKVEENGDVTVEGHIVTNGNAISGTYDIQGTLIGATNGFTVTTGGYVFNSNGLYQSSWTDGRFGFGTTSGTGNARDMLIISGDATNEHWDGSIINRIGTNSNGDIDVLTIDSTGLQVIGDLDVTGTVEAKDFRRPEEDISNSSITLDATDIGKEMYLYTGGGDAEVTFPISAFVRGDKVIFKDQNATNSILIDYTTNVTTWMDYQGNTLAYGANFKVYQATITCLADGVYQIVGSYDAP